MNDADTYTTTVKIWSDGETPPRGDDLFNRDRCPSAPDGWFREDPAYAAELYAMELGLGTALEARHTVHVVDDEGRSYTFDVEIARSITANVTLVRDGT